jgi:hypothetical protein
MTPNESNRETCGNFFAIEIRISNMKMFREDVKLTERAVAFLANATHDMQSNKALIVISGGIRALLRRVLLKREMYLYFPQTTLVDGSLLDFFRCF